MFGLFKPEQHKFVTLAQMTMEIQRLEDEIVEIGERVSLSNRRVAAEENRAVKAAQQEPLDEAQIELIVANLPENYRGMAKGLLASGAITPALIKSIVKGFVR